VSVGIDLVDLPRFRRVVDRWGDRFLRRVFTPAERSSCEATAQRVLHLAARFAAKEAILKALGPSGIGWTDIEIPRRPGHGVTPKLYGKAGRRLGRRHLSVSLTHTEQAAAAVAVVF
jgi:holo-[acyl-carrier protein] synthase